MYLWMKFYIWGFVFKIIGTEVHGLDDRRLVII